MIRSLTVVLAFVGSVALAPAAFAAPQPCAALTGAVLPAGQVDSAAPVAPSDLVEPGLGAPKVPAGLGFCRIRATLKPSPDSDIKVEIWLPDRPGWNGKLVDVGNGGFGGSFDVPYALMRPAITRGFAAAGTDLGHIGRATDWAREHPERLIDFAYRANHVTALAAKAVVRAFYGQAPDLAYFQGCSDGGREALMETQRYPDDFDGVIAGDPANAWTRLMTAFAWNTQALLHVSLTPAKLRLIHSAVMDRCDGLDGVRDEVVDDPRMCRFDPGVLLCGRKTGGDCLTQEEVEAVRKVYSGPVGEISGQRLYPGTPPGAESIFMGWDSWMGPSGQQAYFSGSFFRDMVQAPNWSFESFRPERDGALAKARMGKLLNADDPDLTAFRAHGGKLILYHGWADPGISPYGTIDYYRAVRAKLGDQAKSSVRLFMVPGLAHCFTGPGANTFDMLTALDAWRSGGKPPERLIATKFSQDVPGFLGLPAGPVLRTRPLCAWPARPRWSGSGSTDDAANFRCEVAKAAR